MNKDSPAISGRDAVPSSPRTKPRQAHFGATQEQRRCHQDNQVARGEVRQDPKRIIYNLSTYNLSTTS